MSYGIALVWTSVVELKLVKNAAGLSLPLAQDATAFNTERDLCINLRRGFLVQA